MKEKCWQQVAEEVSAVSGMCRSSSDVKKKWTCMKSNAKLSVANTKKYLQQTGKVNCNGN